MLAFTARFYHAGEDGENTGTCFGLGAVADSTQNYPVAQCTFRFVVGQRQMGMIQYPEDRVPIIEHFHRQRTRFGVSEKTHPLAFKPIVFQKIAI